MSFEEQINALTIDFVAKAADFILAHRTQKILQEQLLVRQQATLNSSPTLVENKTKGEVLTQTDFDRYHKISGDTVHNIVNQNPNWLLPIAKSLTIQFQQAVLSSESQTQVPQEVWSFRFGEKNEAQKVLQQLSQSPTASTRLHFHYTITHDIEEYQNILSTLLAEIARLTNELPLTRAVLRQDSEVQRSVKHATTDVFNDKPFSALKQAENTENIRPVHKYLRHIAFPHHVFLLQVQWQAASPPANASTQGSTSPTRPKSLAVIQQLREAEEDEKEQETSNEYVFVEQEEQGVDDYYLLEPMQYPINELEQGGGEGKRGLTARAVSSGNANQSHNQKQFRKHSDNVVLGREERNPSLEKTVQYALPMRQQMLDTLKQELREIQANLRALGDPYPTTLEQQIRLLNATDKTE